jgi:hypothetical protein
MASGRRARLERLLKVIEDDKYGWLHERGLAALLPHMTGDDDDDRDYADCEGASGLWGLLYYVDPRTERPSNHVAR